MNRKHIPLSNGDTIDQDRDNIIFTFSGQRHVLSTSSLHGGMREDLTAVFNHCDKDIVTGRCDMHGDTYEDHLTWICGQIGLDPAAACGLSTAADLSLAAMRQEHFHGYTVTVLCSGGIARNGRRAGDTATMWEENGIYHVDSLDRLPAGISTGDADKAGEIVKHVSGTLNLMIHIDADLSEGAMATAMMVAVEAKAATVMDWKLKSCYSDRIASGSGTDGVIVVSDADACMHLLHASTDVKLGEMIASCVEGAVNEQIETQLRMLAEEKDQ